VTIFNGSRTVALSRAPQLLVSASAPAGEYDEVFFTVSSATVFKVHITGGMRLSGGSTEKLLISFPHVTYAGGQIIISPSITAQVIP
jgi:hypothetical protein